MKNKGLIFLLSVLVIGLMPLSLVSGETTPPTVNITSHSTNDDVSGLITITATASDSGSGIDFLQFYFGGELISTDSSSPYSSTSINVTFWDLGAQTISVVAFDNDMNFAVDSVIVNNKEDWHESHTTKIEDEVWIWKWYRIYIDEIEVWGVGDHLRKVEFDWYTDDINSNVYCKWFVHQSGYELYGESGTLSTPSTDPTHVTLEWDHGDFSYYTYPCYLNVLLRMYRYGNEILSVGYSFPMA